MKKRFFGSLTIFTLILLFSPSVMATEVPQTKQVVTEEISRQQMEAQITFFDAALNEFGASSPEQAVDLWTKGDKTRNGVFKYSVSSESMKETLIKRWGKPEKSFWIIGGSSPWLTSYQVLSKADVSPTEKVFTIQYNWATSAGPENPSVEKLVVQRFGDKWFISKVIAVRGEPTY